MQSDVHERIVSFKGNSDLYQSLMVGDSYLDMSGLFGVVQKLTTSTLEINTRPTMEEYRAILENRYAYIASTLHTTVNSNIPLLIQGVAQKIHKAEFEKQSFRKERGKVMRMYQKRADIIYSMEHNIEKLEEEILHLQERYIVAMNNHNKEALQLKRELALTKKKLYETKPDSSKHTATEEIHNMSAKEQKQHAKQSKKEIQKRKREEKKALIVF